MLFGGSKNTYDFLRNDVGARAAAQGGGFITMSDDPDLIFYNPAGLGTLTRSRVSFGFLKHLLDINSGYASYGTEVPNLGMIGVGVVYINYGEFDRTGEEGQDLGTFGAGDLVLNVGYGAHLNGDFTYGVGPKLIYSKIGEVNSTGGALDLGVQYIAIPNRLRLGASLLNLGTQFDLYANSRESLPIDFRFGMSLTPEHLPATITLSFQKVNERQEDVMEHFKAFSVGSEFIISPNLLIRAGYNNERRQELKVGSSSGLAGFSIGAGFVTDTYNLDYAYNSYGSIGALHRISLSL